MAFNALMAAAIANGINSANAEVKRSRKVGELIFTDHDGDNTYTLWVFADDRMAVYRLGSSWGAPQAVSDYFLSLPTVVSGSNDFFLRALEGRYKYKGYKTVRRVPAPDQMSEEVQMKDSGGENVIARHAGLFKAGAAERVQFADGAPATVKAALMAMDGSDHRQLKEGYYGAVEGLENAIEKLADEVRMGSSILAAELKILEAARSALNRSGLGRVL